jgi:hypothetical protein
MRGREVIRALFIWFLHRRLRAFAALSLQPFCARVADELSRSSCRRRNAHRAFAVEFDLTRLLVSPGEIAERMSKLCNADIQTPNMSAGTHSACPTWKAAITCACRSTPNGCRPG